jgi:hypothetical protein
MTTIPPPPSAPQKPLPLPAGDAAAQILEAWEAAAAEIINTAVTLARRGDIAALRLILERIAPTPRGRTLSLEGMPRLESVADVPRLHAHLVELVAAGTIATEEAAAMSSVLERYVASIAAVDHEQRLAAIEQSIETNRASH